MGRISKSQVSRLCAEIDERVSAFLGRPIEGDWPYLWITKVREAGGIVSVAAIVAVGVNTNGRREVLGPSRRGSPTVGRRNPLRWFTRAGVRPPGAAPYKPSTTSAIRRSATKPIIAQEIGSGATLQEVLKRDPVYGHRGVRSVLVQVRQPHPIGVRDDRVARGAPRQTHWRSLGAPRSAPPTPVPGHRRSRSSRIATAVPRPCSPASCRSAAGTTSSASQLSPMPFSIASCTTPQRIELKGDSLRKRQRAPS
jgi:Transposase, Mutator family